MPSIGLATPSIVTGYHGCALPVANLILAGGSFLLSRNGYDWLGQGVYFWEKGVHRASEWAVSRHGGDGRVLQANINLGNCLDLLDTAHFDNLREASKRYIARATELCVELPRNEGKLHRLDRQVIEYYCQDYADVTGTEFQTVRGCFPEGDPLFEGSSILRETHVQIAVRDVNCIHDVTLVEL